jgi:hypothetical protein
MADRSPRASSNSAWSTALRILTLFEMLVRRGQDHDSEELAGLDPGQAKRTTDRPTAQRVLGYLGLSDEVNTRLVINSG